MLIQLHILVSNVRKGPDYRCNGLHTVSRQKSFTSGHPQPQADLEVVESQLSRCVCKQAEEPLVLEPAAPEAVEDQGHRLRTTLSAVTAFWSAGLCGSFWTWWKQCVQQPTQAGGIA